MHDSAENRHRPAKESPALGAGQYSLGSGEGNSLTVGLTPGMNQRSIVRGRGSFLAIRGTGRRRTELLNSSSSCAASLCGNRAVLHRCC